MYFVKKINQYLTYFCSKEIGALLNEHCVSRTLLLTSEKPKSFSVMMKINYLEGVS